jgi:hypothetical protein
LTCAGFIASSKLAAHIPKLTVVLARIFRERVPLTDAEFQTIAGNVTRFAH